MDADLEIEEMPGAITLWGPEGFAGMRRAGQVAAATLDYITPHVVPGVTTAQLNQLCEAFVSQNGAKSATIGYRGYQHGTCISLNHVVCHGIPGDRVLVDGDILNIDVTVIVDGWFGDNSRMYIAGDNPSLQAQKLIDATYEALWRGIEAVKPGATLGDIGHAIQSHVEPLRFSVVRDFCGHGLGREFHAAPSILHYGKPGRGLVLKPGMFFTIEPMVNAGKADIKILPDGWTAVTRDRSLSAQFEHSLGVTETGYEVFTRSPAGLDKPPYNMA